MCVLHCINKDDDKVCEQFIKSEIYIENDEKIGFLDDGVARTQGMRSTRIFSI